MKKLIYCALALAAGLLATSCMQENLEPVQQGNTVTFNVQLPDVATKASDAVAVDNLEYAVYRVVDSNILEAAAKSELTTKNVAEKKYHLVYQERVDITNRDAISVNLDLMNDQRYVVLFWAQNGNTWFETGTEFINIAYPTNEVVGNDVNREAFTGSAYIEVDGSVSKNIVLTRPFAQLNIATNLPNPARFNNFEVENTVVKVTGVATSFNVATQAANTPTDYQAIYAEAAPFKTATGDYQTFGDYACYLSMNYMFVPTDRTNVTVVYDIKTNYGTVNNTITNVPIQKNYKTNIVGNLLTSGVDYNVTLENWADSGKDMVVVNDGVVKNINRDYEVTNANGLAYAINNLFAQGGNFYLTKALYDLTGYAVNPPAVPAGKELNIYGETPVVTRAASTLAGITIIGLPEVEGTPTLIAQVEEGGSVSVSGVTLDDERSVLVKNNVGTLVVSESSADKFVAEGNAPVDAKEVKDFASLKAAIASGVKVIEIAADIARTDNDKAEVVIIDRSVTINGNDCTFNTAANRAFRLTVSDIEVTFNNLNIVSSAVMVYPSDVRGVSIDPDLSNVSLTMNDCSIDFTDVTTNDWTYAINVTGGNDNTVVINGGSYEGANVINVRGEKQTITIDGAELTSLYPSNETYYGACLYVLWYSESQITLVNSVLNGNNAVAINGCEDGKGNILVEENNTDNTKLYLYKAGSNLYYTLAEAIDAIESTGEVKVLHDAEAESVTIPNGKTITLNLNDKTIEGVDNATGSYAVITNKGNLTVVGPGAVKLTATNNRGWNAYSSVISNTVGGNLTVQGEVVIEHLGGTDMAYGIDNLTNGKGTSAITTINKATVKSPYRAIRQFLNGIEATNELYVNPEAVIEGANKSIWMQDPSTNANTGKLVVEEGAELYGDVYLSVTAGSTEWPVSASIPTATLMNGSKVLTGNLPEGYSVEEKNGVYEVTYKSPAQARLEALINEGGEVVLTENIELSSPIVIENLTVNLDLNGKTITAGKDGYAIENKGELTIKNNGVINGVVYAEGPTAKTTINGGTYNALTNWVFLNSQGAFLEINDATINGGSSYPIYSYDANSKLVINDATVNATFGCINAYGTNGSVEINGGTFQMTGVQGKTSHIAYFSNVDAVINGGTFEKVGDINMSGTGGGGICAIYGAALKIVKGTFAGDYADLYDWGGKNANNRAVAISVEGGTYKFQPTFLPEGFAATQNADGTWTVAKN